MTNRLRSEVLKIASELPKGDETRRELLAALHGGPVDELLSAMLVGSGMDRPAMEAFEKAALRFPEGAVLEGIAAWAKENAREVKQAGYALSYLKNLERDGRADIFWSGPSSLYGEAAKIYDMLDDVFP